MEFLSSLGYSILMISISPCLATYIISGYRLITKDRPNAGIIELYNDDVGWGRVCSYYIWGSGHSSEVCRQLNFPGFSKSLTVADFREEVDGWPISVTNDTGAYYWDCSVEDINMRCNTYDAAYACDLDDIRAVTCKEPGYLGCYSNPYALLQDRPGVFVNVTDYNGKLTIHLCIATCEESGFFYAGVEYAYQCFCGRRNEVYDRHGLLSDGECNYDCDGDAFETCGGGNKIAVYQVDLGVCDDPGTPRNGFRYNETDSLRYGSKLYFNCFDGYILEGPDVIQCVKTYDGGEDVSIADNSHAVTWNNDPPICTRMGSTTSSTRSTVTITGGALTSTMTLNETPGSGKQKEHQFIIYIGIGIASSLLLLIVIIVLVVNIRKRRKRQQRSTASNLQPNEHDNYMPLNVRSGRGFADGRGSGDGQEVETDAYQALNAPPQRSNGTHPRIETARSTEDDQENLSHCHEYDDASSTRTLDGQQTKNQGGRDEHEKIASHDINLYGNQQVIDLRQKRGRTNISTEVGESDYLEPI